MEAHDQACWTMNKPESTSDAMAITFPDSRELPEPQLRPQSLLIYRIFNRFYRLGKKENNSIRRIEAKNHVPNHDWLIPGVTTRFPMPLFLNRPNDRGFIVSLNVWPLQTIWWESLATEWPQWGSLVAQRGKCRKIPSSFNEAYAPESSARWRSRQKLIGR